MPIKVIKNLPAITKLAQENIFVMDTERAETQQIRPLHILLINLMPTKEVTETQILRALSNSPLQVNLTLLHTASRKSKNVDIIPANSDLCGLEIELLSVDKREYLLKSEIDKIPQNYDFILVDCPPSLSILSINALVASQSVLIPIQCEYYALEGVSQLMNTVNVIRKGLNPELLTDQLRYCQTVCVSPTIDAGC